MEKFLTQLGTFVEIAVKIIKNHKLLSLVLILFCIMYFPHTSAYKESLGELDWMYRCSDNIETIQTNVDLKSGSIVVTPQIVVKYEGKIVLVLNIKNFYITNTVVMKKNDSTGNTEFELKIADGQAENLADFQHKLVEFIVNEARVSYSFEASGFSIYNIRVADVSYQTMYSNNAIERPLYISSGETRIMNPTEMQLRNSGNWYDINKYSTSTSLYTDDSIKSIVQECLDFITGGKK